MTDDVICRCVDSLLTALDRVDLSHDEQLRILASAIEQLRAREEVFVEYAGAQVN